MIAIQIGEATKIEGIIVDGIRSKFFRVSDTVHIHVNALLGCVAVISVRLSQFAKA